MNTLWEFIARGGGPIIRGGRNDTASPHRRKDFLMELSSARPTGTETSAAFKSRQGSRQFF